MVGAAIGGDEANLTLLGLSADEARAFVALVERGRLTASELATATGITRGRIYDVARGLIVKGVALEAASQVRSFEPVEPEIAVSNLLDSRRREMEHVEQRATTVIRSLDGRRAASPAPPGFVETLRHGPNLRERLDELYEAAQAEIVVFSRPPYYAMQPWVEEQDPAVQALRRGVKIRVVYDSVVLGEPGERAAIEQWSKWGEEARHLDGLPTKMIVFDRNVAMLPLAEPGNERNIITLVCRHPGLAQLAASAFDRAWERAEAVPVQEPRQNEGTVP